MITGLLYLLVRWLGCSLIKTYDVLDDPIRVVERQMDGCMAHDMTREDYGTVIDYDLRELHGSSPNPQPYWLIQWDDDREDSWYPKCFFMWQDDDDDGTWVRTM